MDKALTHQRRLRWGKVAAFILLTTFFLWSFAIPNQVMAITGADVSLIAEANLVLAQITKNGGIRTTKTRDNDDDDHPPKTPQPTQQKTKKPVVETPGPTKHVSTPIPSDIHKTPTFASEVEPTNTIVSSTPTFTPSETEESTNRHDPSATPSFLYFGREGRISTSQSSPTLALSITPTLSALVTPQDIESPTASSDPLGVKDLLDNIPRPEGPIFRDLQRYQLPIAIASGILFVIIYQIRLGAISKIKAIWDAHKGIIVRSK